MSRIGLSIDELVARTWTGDFGARYVAHAEGLDLLAGEVVALVGPSARSLRERLEAAVPKCLPIDGSAAARAGTLRVRAVEAARRGARVVAVSCPLAGDPDADAASLALADLASLGELGLTAVTDLADPTAAALVADRVVVVGNGRPEVAYPVLASRPRREAEVHAVAERALWNLAAT